MGNRRVERLFRRYRIRGDVEALGKVFDSVAPELARIAGHLVGDAAEAEDLLQSTFLTALEKAADFDDERRLLPWMVGILVRHAANARRRRGRDRRLIASTPGGVEALEDKLPDAAQLAEERETRFQLERAVEGLAPTYRAVLVPHLFEDKGAHALAGDLGISVGAVRVRLHRGLKVLRAALPAGALTVGSGSARAEPLSATTLETLRADVLEAARGLAPRLVSSAPATLSASTFPASAWLGGLFMSQRLLLSVALTLVLATSLTLVLREGGATQVPTGVPKENPELLTLHAEEVVPDANAEAEGLLPASVDSREKAPHTRGLVFQGRVSHRFTQEPIAGARLLASSAHSNAPELMATCDEEGRFEFRAPASVEDSLVVEAQGFASWLQPLSAERRERSRSHFGRRELEGGRGVDLGTILLCPGVNFLGRALWAKDRSPAGGAELLVFSGGERLGTIEERVVGRTRADGTLELDHLIPVIGAEPYVLMALHDEGIGWVHVPPAGDRTSIEDLELLLAPPFQLEVTVWDADHEAVVGATVLCIPRVPPFPAGGMQRESDPFFPAPPALFRRLAAETDERGVARLDALLPASDSTMDPSANHHFAATLEVLVDGEVWARDRLSVRGANSGSRLVILPSAESDWIRGRVLDENASPIQGIAVRMDPVGRTVLTNEQGEFLLERGPVDPDLVVLHASAEGLVEARRQLNFSGGSTPLDGHDLVLLPPMTIEGVLQDDSGHPIVGTRVVAYEGKGEGRIAGEGDQQGTDENGHFVIEDATAGEWRLWPYFGSAKIAGRYHFPQEGFIVQGGDRDLRIVLERKPPATGALVVTVVDAAGGGPVDPVRAQLFPREVVGMLPVPRLGPGKVSFEDLLPGTYDLWVATAKRRVAHSTFEIDGAEPRSFGRVEVGEAGSLVGQVKLAGIDLQDGRLPERSFVMGRKQTANGMFPSGGAFEGATATWVRTEIGERGSFSAEDLMPGLWSFELQATGLISRMEAELRSGEELEIRLEPKRAAVLELVPERSPGSGWMVVEYSTHDGNWEQGKMAHLSEKGPLPPCSLTLEPGLVRWRVSFQSGFGPFDDALAAPQEGEAELGAGDHQRVEVRVE